MNLSRTENALVMANSIAVISFCAWTLAVLFGAASLASCCEAPRYVEMLLAAINLPSWGAAELASALVQDSVTATLVTKQITWSALVWPQWLLYILLYRRARVGAA